MPSTPRSSLSWTERAVWTTVSSPQDGLFTDAVGDGDVSYGHKFPSDD